MFVLLVTLFHGQSLGEPNGSREIPSTIAVFRLNGCQLMTMDYRQSGVDIEAGDEFVNRIKPVVRSTFRKEVLSELGGFGGLFRFPSERFTDPVLVSGTDGVGTKVKIASMMDRHDTVGIDLVAMCVNDIAVSGAEPLFFLDYMAVGSQPWSNAESIVKGIAEGCRQAGCALIGGETAEMPSMYQKGEYELAGFAVGVVERARIIDGKGIRPGDVLIGVGSTGLHSNGYSLARKVLFDKAKLTTNRKLAGMASTLGEVLLAPTRIYVKLILDLIAEYSIRGIAHITGGGLTGNIPRVLPQGCVAQVRRGAWEVPPIFQHVQEIGEIEEEEMYRVFNMGIGLVLVTPPDQVNPVLARIKTQGEKGYVIGSIGEKPGEPPVVEYMTEAHS